MEDLPAEIQRWSEILRNVSIFIGGAAGLWIAWRRVTAATRQADAALRQTEHSRRGRVAELCNVAIGQLADEKLEVRLGAIFMLRQIANDFPEFTRALHDLLATYLRTSVKPYDGDPPADVQEIMKILRD